MTTQTDLSAEEPSERAATGAQPNPLTQAMTEGSEPTTEPDPEPDSDPKSTTPVPKIAEAAIGSVTYTDLSAQEPTSRATAEPTLGPKLKAGISFKTPGGTNFEAGATVEVPSGSPIETAIARFIERCGLICVLVILVGVLAGAGVDAWIIAAATGGLLTIAFTVMIARKRASKD